MGTIQKWILVMTLIASAAGGAAGTVLAGLVDGDIAVSVSQPITLQKPAVLGLSPGRPWFSSVSDQSTEFSAALQLYQGESAQVKLPVVNRADVDHVIELNITAPVLPVPQGANPADYNINLEVDGLGVVTDLVRVGAYKWKATIPAVAAGGNDGLLITIALGDAVPPGYYEISGQIQVVPY